MKNQLLFKQQIQKIIIIVLLGVMFSSCGMIVKCMLGFHNPQIYSSYPQADSVINKQLKKRKIHYIVLYNAHENCFLSFDITGLFFDNQTQLIVPSECIGCKFNDTVQGKSTFYDEIHQPDKDTVYLKDIIHDNLVNKDTIPFDPSWLKGYQYTVVLDRVTFISKSDKEIVNHIKRTRDVDSVLFIFINKDFYEGTELVKKMRESGNVKNNKISSKISKSDGKE
jgi:hypothetical protein